MASWKIFWSKLFDVLDDVLAYILTIAGIIFSNYIPMLNSGESIAINLDIGRVVVAAVVALLIIGKQESLGGENTEAARKGRRKNFSARMLNALAHGVAWSQLMNLAS